MDFWMMDVLSTVQVNGKDVEFDYCNTYHELHDALKDAKLLSLNEDVFRVSVYHLVVCEDGSHTLVKNGNKPDMPFDFINKNHREMRGC